MRNKYIKEIQSLRGISVILVFLFHINQEIFSLGYIGVDIFFVISGFVITKIIYENIETGDFNIKNFYISRFLRLFPALALMVLTFIVFIILSYKLHSGADLLINTGIFSLLGLSNLYLIFIENDYFNSFDENIFEHMWSLSIEIQFYFIYPLFFFISKRFLKFNKNIFSAIIVFLIILHFLINIFNTYEFFYFTHTRIGEILIGCLTYFIQKNNRGILLIFFISIFFFIIFYFTKEIFYLINSVCFVTSLVILNIQKLSIFNRFLNIKFLNHIGNLSYSIYLWHLPIIYFSKFFLTSFDYYIFPIILTYLVSLTSYYFLETPFRNSIKLRRILSNKIFLFRNFSILSILLVTIIISIDSTNTRNKIFNKLSDKYKSISKNFNLVNFPSIKNEHNQLCHENYKISFFEKNCFVSNNSEKLIYFFGDSSMLDFYEVFLSFNYKVDKAFSSYNNSSFFKPIFKNYKYESDENIYKKDNPTQKLKNNIVKFSKKYDEIILITSFIHTINYERTNKSKKYFDNQKLTYENIIEILPTNVKLVFIKDTPFYKHSAKNCEALKSLSFKVFSNKQNNSYCDIKKIDIEKKMNKLHNMFNDLESKKGLKILDLDEYFCDNKSCSFYKNKMSKSFAKKFDGYHFTVETSKDIREVFYLKIDRLLND